MIDILIYLIGDLNFSSVIIIECVNRERFINSKLGMIFDLFMRIISGNMVNYDKYKRDNILNQIQDIELPHGDIDHEIYYYSIFAIVVSYLQPAVDRLIVTQKVLNKFSEKNPYRDSLIVFVILDFGYMQNIRNKSFQNFQVKWKEF